MYQPTDDRSSKLLTPLLGGRLETGKWKLCRGWRRQTGNILWKPSLWHRTAATLAAGSLNTVAALKAERPAQRLEPRGRNQQQWPVGQWHNGHNGRRHLLEMRQAENHTGLVGNCCYGYRYFF